MLHVSDVPIKKAIIRFATGKSRNHDRSELFRFVLYTDGTGTLYDVNYHEKLGIGHEIDLHAFAKTGSVILIDSDEPISNGIYDEEITLSNETIASNDDELDTKCHDLFYEFNDVLKNPVGDCPKDFEMTVTNGSVEKFRKSLSAISYLATLNNIDGVMSLATAVNDLEVEQEIQEWHQLDEKLDEIVLAVLVAYDPRASYYEYVDQNDGRITAFEAGGASIDVDKDTVANFFSSARERLAAKAWLREEFSIMGIDPALIDKTFPTQSGVS
jgi:hypothetical protein